MLNSLQDFFKAFPLDTAPVKFSSVNPEAAGPVSFGELLKLKEKQLRQEQQVSATTVAAAVTALQTILLGESLPVQSMETSREIVEKSTSKLSTEAISRSVSTTSAVATTNAVAQFSDRGFDDKASKISLQVKQDVITAVSPCLELDPDRVTAPSAEQIPASMAKEQFSAIPPTVGISPIIDSPEMIVPVEGNMETNGPAAQIPSEANKEAQLVSKSTAVNVIAPRLQTGKRVVSFQEPAAKRPAWKTATPELEFTRAAAPISMGPKVSTTAAAAVGKFNSAVTSDQERKNSPHRFPETSTGSGRHKTELSESETHMTSPRSSIKVIDTDAVEPQATESWQDFGPPRTAVNEDIPDSKTAAADKESVFPPLAINFEDVATQTPPAQVVSDELTAQKFSSNVNPQPSHSPDAAAPALSSLSQAAIKTETLRAREKVERSAHISDSNLPLRGSHNESTSNTRTTTTNIPVSATPFSRPSANFETVIGTKPDSTEAASKNEWPRFTDGLNVQTQVKTSPRIPSLRADESGVQLHRTSVHETRIYSKQEFDIATDVNEIESDQVAAPEPIRQEALSRDRAFMENAAASSANQAEIKGTAAIKYEYVTPVSMSGNKNEASSSQKLTNYETQADNAVGVDREALDNAEAQGNRTIKSATDNPILSKSVKQVSASALSTTDQTVDANETIQHPETNHRKKTLPPQESSHKSGAPVTSGSKIGPATEVVGQQTKISQPLQKPSQTHMTEAQAKAYLPSSGIDADTSISTADTSVSEGGSKPDAAPAEMRVIAEPFNVFSASTDSLGLVEPKPEHEISQAQTAAAEKLEAHDNEMSKPRFSNTLHESRQGVSHEDPLRIKGVEKSGADTLQAAKIPNPLSQTKDEAEPGNAPVKEPRSRYIESIKAPVSVPGQALAATQSPKDQDASVSFAASDHNEHEITGKVKETVKDEKAPPVEREPKMYRVPGDEMRLNDLAKEKPTGNNGSNAPTNQLHASVKEVAQHVIRHLNSNPRSGPTSMRLQLNPQDLGEIDVQMVSDSHGVHVTFFAEQAATGRLLENQLDQLRASLVDSGVHLSGLDVGQDNQSGQKGGSFEQSPNFIRDFSSSIHESRTDNQEALHPVRSLGQLSDIDYLV
jgi:flagellar hook-length control protein FliK